MAKATLMIGTTAGQPGGSPVLDNVVEKVGSAFASLGDVVNNEALVTVSIPGGGVDFEVRHQLGYIPKARDIVDIDANATIWRSPTVNADPRNTVILRASAAVTVTLRFT